MLLVINQWKDNLIKLSYLIKIIIYKNFTNIYYYTYYYMDHITKGNTIIFNNEINELESNNQIIKIRVFECAICNSKTHSITKCSKYCELKNNLKKKNYLIFNTDRLNDNEEQGFCASGIIPYIYIENKIYLLVLIEKRKNKNGLNFIGGKRECILFNNTILPETSYETGLNELEEELGEILTKESVDMITEQIKKCKIPNFVFWSGDSKMCLYGIKLPSEFLSLLSLNNKDKTNTEAQGFKWIELNKCQYIENNYIKNEDSKIINFHYYSKNIIRGMKKIAKNKKLINIFI